MELKCKSLVKCNGKKYKAGEVITLGKSEKDKKIANQLFKSGVVEFKKGVPKDVREEAEKVEEQREQDEAYPVAGQNPEVGQA